MVYFYLTNFHLKSAPHRIHAQGCSDMPSMEDLAYLGPFNNSDEALRNAERKYSNVQKCEKCCSPRKQAILNSIHASEG